VVCLGFFIIFRVFAVNSYTSGIVEVAAGQTVISTGPYAVVRHPMYSGAALMFIATPLALASYWGLVVGILIIVAMCVRALDEERLLREELPGYVEYTRKVRARLIPGVW
jgi:protein-S-isoprenylcysteine O-methyltransferase Ste14